MKLKDLLPDDRPREKLLLKGARALSSAELLAILLGSGFQGKNVADVARDLLYLAEGKLSLLCSMSPEKMAVLKGIGTARAVTVSAALELGRRCYEELAAVDLRSITSPAMVHQLMLPLMKDLDHEECWVMYLNRSHYLIGKEMICKGTLDQTTLDVHRILRRAIEKQCRHLILVHNHPSGTVLPSEADINQTGLLRKALESVGIKLSDHVIISPRAFFSFTEDKATTYEKFGD
ncbi:MAG: DNA repair protein RadC [Bacteroidales bacterium]|nr:DNA repair protein RadC [Bacteroidales bacterium]